ncbi:MAG: glycosyltransferase family 2 protein [Lachnospiraceae bacterium]|nr:glycosyltransferase family 2 protein [Lachnospiraceae bacterium]
MNPISICMIVKNEAKNIVACLDSIQKLNCELIIVDTGSTDQTKELALQYTNQVFDFVWCDDFSAARNFSISKSSNNWILVLDADEVITNIDLPAILTWISTHPSTIGTITRINHYESNETDTVYVDQVERLFCKQNYCYQGIIHEQVVPCSANSVYQIEAIPLQVDHSGYCGSPEEMLAKSNRNIALLKTELDRVSGTVSENAYLYFQLGQAYNAIHDDANALYYYEKGLSFDVDPSMEYVQMMVIGYGYALLHLNRPQDALSLLGIYDEFAVSADFYCLIGLIYLRNGDLLHAMAEFIKALNSTVSHVVGANTFIPRYNMGCILELTGDISGALKQYRLCEDFAPALEKINVLAHNL